MTTGYTKLTPGFIADHKEAMAHLLATLELEERTIKLYGKPVKMPRLVGWYGDASRSYTFSGETFTPKPMTGLLSVIRHNLHQSEGVNFNSCLVNLYRDGSDSVGWHADDEPMLGPSPDDIRIASISLGADRRFLLRENADRSRKSEFLLGGGSLLVMGGDLQKTHQHSVPKTKRPVGPRMNLTFRVIR